MNKLILGYVLLAVVWVGAAWAGPREFGNNHVVLTVTPDQDLGTADTVMLEGSGFIPSMPVVAVQCSTATHGPNTVVCSSMLAAVLSDSNGHIGPVAVPISQTFTGTTGGNDPQTATHTCAPFDDCYLYVISQAKQLRYRTHHLDFAE